MNDESLSSGGRPLHRMDQERNDKRLLAMLLSAAAAVLVLPGPSVVWNITSLLEADGTLMEVLPSLCSLLGLYLAAAFLLHLQRNASDSCASLTGAAVLLIGCTILMGLTQWKMMFLVAAGTAFTQAVLYALEKTGKTYEEARNNSEESLQVFEQERFNAHQLIRISRAKRETMKQLEPLNRALYEADRKQLLCHGLFLPLGLGTKILGYALVCLYGAALVAQGTAELGIIPAFLLYAYLFGAACSHGLVWYRQFKMERSKKRGCSRHNSAAKQGE